VFNVCNTDAISALQVAACVAAEFPQGTPHVTASEGEQGWRGDVPTLNVWPERLLDRGWRPIYTSDEAIRVTARALMTEWYEAAGEGC